MTRGRKIAVIAIIVIVGFVGWIACDILYTLRGIPEAYMAWDTGTLLIEYMKQHDDQWPKSWDELLTVLDSDEVREIRIHGAQAWDITYVRVLREKIAIDWTFDPTHANAVNPVMRCPTNGGHSGGG